MSVKPILFSSPMVRALLEGRKTQTRRVAKHVELVRDLASETMEDLELRGWDDFGDVMAKVSYAVGDLLWVRERGWIAVSKTAFLPFVGNEEAVNPEGWPTSPGGTPYKNCPSIHMPRWASRLTLEVTSVRVERLQDISKEDVTAEGLTEREGEPLDGVVCGWHEPFAQIWDATYGDGAWNANPWVVALTFTVHKCSIDDMPNSRSEVAA